MLRILNKGGSYSLLPYSWNSPCSCGFTYTDKQLSFRIIKLIKHEL